MSLGSVLRLLSILFYFVMLEAAGIPAFDMYNEYRQETEVVR